MRDLSRTPHLAFPIEGVTEEGSPGSLWAFPCACGDINDLTLLFMRDESQREELSPSDARGIEACIRSDVVIAHPFSPAQRLFQLWRFEPTLLLEFFSLCLDVLDAIPGLPLRLFELLKSLGWLTGSLATAFTEQDGATLVPLLRKMGHRVILNNCPDGSVFVNGFRFFWNDIPLRSLFAWLLRGNGRFRCRLILYRNGESDAWLD